MPENHHFNREDVFPSYFVAAFQNFLSAARTDLRLSKKTSSVIQIVPDTELGIAAVAIEGRWRWITEPIERNHPGGAKGTYVVWAVAEDNNVTNVPNPFTDHTNYAFDLRITSGAEPSGAGIAILEKIGEIDWSGIEIEALRQTHGSVTGAMLANDALPATANSDLEWKREPGGGYLLQLKKGVVGSSEVADSLRPSAGAAAGTEALRALGETASTAAAGNDGRLSDSRVPIDGSVTPPKVADSLKPSKEASAATEALRALGTSASTAAAGNDPRLSDERTPKANSVNSSKIEDGTVTDVDLASPNNGVYRTLLSANALLAAGVPEAAGTILPRANGTVASVPFAVGSMSPVYFFWNPTGYTVSGMTTKLRLRFQVACGAVASGITLIAGLYPLKVASGSYALSVVAANSPVEIASPAANKITHADSIDFLPPGEGAMVIGIAVSAKADVALELAVQLQLRYV